MYGKAKESWRMLRCAGASEDKSVIERIMLGFRPIAPKPVNGDTVAGNVQVDNKNLSVSNSRSKRKYVRVRKDNGYNKKKINKATDYHENGSNIKDGLNNKIVTLQLLPERGDFEDSTRRGSWCNDLDVSGKEKVVVDYQEQAMRLELKNKVLYDVGGFDMSDQTVVMAQKRVVESWVTVESVTNHTCMDAARVLGSEDVEIMKNLERDTCPGFISDGLNKVKWVNGAYKRMVMVWQENEDSGEQSSSAAGTTSLKVVVLLVMKEKFPWLFSSLTCRVRVEYYTWQKKKYSKMVPCDVWRMDCGGFAWRLDVEAALSLGR